MNARAGRERSDDSPATFSQNGMVPRIWDVPCVARSQHSYYKAVSLGSRNRKKVFPSADKV